MVERSEGHVDGYQWLVVNNALHILNNAVYAILLEVSLSKRAFFS